MSDATKERRAPRAIIGGFGIAAVVLGAVALDHKADQIITPAEDVRVIDGDTFYLNNESIRLNGIDTKEKPASLDLPCRRGVCAESEGEWDLARLNLAYALTFGDLRLERIKLDRYGRTIAQVSAGTLDVSCYMLRTGNARYMPQWDEGGRTKAKCPTLAQ